MNRSAESIALCLDQGRRIRPDHYIACCPAHDDRNPSLSVTQAGDRVLLYCHSGCTQTQVIDALAGRGLWMKKSGRQNVIAPTYTKDELEYYLLFCLIYRDNSRNGYTPTREEQLQFKAFSRVCHSHGRAYGV